MGSFLLRILGFGQCFTDAVLLLPLLWRFSYLIVCSNLLFWLLIFLVIGLTNNLIHPSYCSFSTRSKLSKN
jgi:hypothetical protein